MLQVDDLTYRIAGKSLFEGASVRIPGRHKVGLVGRNGVGKTTLLRLILGDVTPDGGSVKVRRGASVGILTQEAPGGSHSILDEVLKADRERGTLLAEAETASDPARIGEIHARLADIGAHAAPARAAAILAGLGFGEDQHHRPLDEFSGGWRMRVALAGLLFAAPDLLLLDEPTNYLDLEASLWLEVHLKAYPRTLILVSHDRDFLNAVPQSILHLERGRLTLHSGNYDDFERRRRESLALQSKMHARQQAQRRHMQAFVDRFRYKATKARQAQSRLKALARMEPIAAVMEERTAPIGFPDPKDLAPPLLTLENAEVGYAAGQPVLRNLNLRIDGDDRIALLGANGNGKTTLARLLCGRLDPMVGARMASPKLRVGYFSQLQLEELEPARTAFGHLRRLMEREPEAKVRARIAQFGFSQDKADVPVTELSGGERARLLLALMSHDAPHLMVLDEPTNHLDVDSREALLQALNACAAAIVLISHDRHLLETCADRLWLVADGTVRPFEGDLDEYRARALAERGGPRLRAEGRETRPAASKRGQRKAAARARAEIAPLRKAAARAEAELAALTRERSALEEALADPGLYTGDPLRLTELTKRRGALDRAVAEAEEAWLAAQAAIERRS